MEEAHRCGHIAPFLIRQSTVDTELLGHEIPKGTHILFYHCGQSSTKPAFTIAAEKRTEHGRIVKKRFGIWNNTDISTFNPNRWLNTERMADGSLRESFNPHAGPQLGFGLGLRGCTGKRLAYMEMRITIVLLIWSLEFLPLDEYLSSLESVDFFALSPLRCYVKVKKTQ